MAFVGPALVVLGYLLGSILFGMIIASRRGVDLRGGGSGNVGATNVERLLGKRDGRIVMLLDALKGLLPVLAARLVLGPDDPWVAATGVAAVLGHCLPAWHRLHRDIDAGTGLIAASYDAAGVATIAEGDPKVHSWAPVVMSTACTDPSWEATNTHLPKVIGDATTWSAVA